jgi:FkbM family methyltransferase
MTKLEIIARCCRTIPSGLRGKARLTKNLLGSQLNARDVRIRDRSGNLYLIPSLREPVGFHLLIDGVYEQEVQSFILQRLEEGSVFVDVGANIGAVTIPAARTAGRVLAIEASPSVFPYLAQNIKANHLENVRCMNVAAGREEAYLPFYTAPMEHFGMGSFGPQFNAQPTQVPAVALDQILADEKIGRVDLIKIDVEGFELAVLQGARRLLANDRPPVIIFEFCDWAEARVPDGKVGDAQRFLASLGYSMWRLRDFSNRRPALAQPIVQGFEMLVAAR